MSSPMDEILGIFCEEVTGNIEELERLFLELRLDSDAAAFKTVFRIAHNIKGSSKSVGMGNMGRVTHELETLLIKLGDGRIDLSPEILNVLLVGVDSLKALLSRAQEAGSDDLDVAGVTESIKAAQLRGEEAKLARQMNGAQDGDIFFIGDDPTAPEKLLGALEAVPPPAELPKADGIAEQLPAADAAQLSLPVPQPSSPAGAPASTGSSGVSKNANETIRVPTFRINRLQNHVGEILVLQSVLSEQLRDHPSTLVRNALRQMRKVTREVQEDSMGLRLVSFKNLFVKLTRAVHDAANALGKEVDFVTVGEDTEVDKVLSEGLADPLMHMVRNSVDHGQEIGVDRVAAGKSRKGRIELSARCEGGFLVVRLSDDGKGLDTDAILAKARSKGIVGPKQELTDQQVYALIFQPSFSTKAVVTEVSGRGVGMDVVQTNIHAMRGHIEIESQRGKGTTFTLTIPLAISLLDGMILQLGDEKWILPLHSVMQSFRYESCQLSNAVGIGQVFNLRGQNIPVVDLGAVLQVPRAANSRDRVVLVVKEKDVLVALVVDSVIAIQTVVSKPLTPEMQARNGVSGCAILGDGQTSLILEISDLHKSTAKARRAA